MTLTRRFHVDQDGHSVTVLLEPRAKDAEVLVDGKVVAFTRRPTKDGTILHAALPTDPPQPITIVVEDRGGTPSCSMMTRYRRSTMPEVSWSREEQRFLPRPLEKLRGLLRRPSARA